MVATPAFVKESSFLPEADFPNMAHSSSEVSAGSGSLSKKEKVWKSEESLLLKLGVCPASAVQGRLDHKPESSANSLCGEVEADTSHFGTHGHTYESRSWYLSQATAPAEVTTSGPGQGRQHVFVDLNLKPQYCHFKINYQPRSWELQPAWIMKQKGNTVLGRNPAWPSAGH